MFSPLAARHRSRTAARNARPAAGPALRSHAQAPRKAPAPWIGVWIGIPALPTLTALCLTGAALAGGCDSDNTVPFKRPNATVEPDGKASAIEPGAAEALPPFVAVQFPDAPASVDLEGAALSRSQGHLHAALVRRSGELNDALVVVSGLDEGVRLERAERTGPADNAPFEELRRVQALPSPHPGCELASAQVEAPSTAHVVARLSWTCHAATAEEAPEPTEAPPAPAGPAYGEHTVHVFSNGRSPRMLETLSLLPNAEQPAPTLLEVGGDDSDGDGHPDLQLWLAVGPQEEPRMAIELLNRSAGLQVSATEPEATMAALADEAQSRLAKHPDQALALTSKILQLQGDYCRGSGSPRIALGGRAGLPCPRSAAAGRAASIRLMAQAQLGDTVAAARTYGELQASGNQLTAADQSRVATAIGRLPHSHRFQFSPGPQLSSLPLPPQHRPLVAFLDETTLLLRGDPPETLDLINGTRTPTAMVPPSALFTDPGGRFVATEFVRDCEGDKVRFFRPTQLLAGRTSGAPVTDLLVRPAPAPQDCRDQSQARRIPRSEMTLLRFGNDGLLIGAGTDLLFLALTPPLNTDGPAQPWQWGRVLPRDPQPDGMAEQPPLIPRVTALGVLLVDARTGHANLVDTTAVPGTIRDVALSPNGQQIALVVGEQVWLGRAQLAH